MFHEPVLLDACIEGLKIRTNGVYVDATFGGGGHSKSILKHLGDKGRLFGIDQDDEAIENQIDDPRFTMIKSNFRYLKNFLNYYQLEQVDGILADFGISSHQIDTPERGFSFRYEAELDMRMNQQNAADASHVINEYGLKELQNVFSKYGEIRNSRTLALRIIERRKEAKIFTIADFLETIESCIKGNRNKYLAQLFQAIRIEVNDEMGALRDFLHQSVKCLSVEGRLVAMSYHSLEDRMVKNLIKSGNVDGNLDKDDFGNIYRPLKAVNKKIITADEEELKRNPRARSAKLRIAEKL